MTTQRIVVNFANLPKQFDPPRFTSVVSTPYADYVEGEKVREYDKVRAVKVDVRGYVHGWGSLWAHLVDCVLDRVPRNQVALITIEGWFRNAGVPVLSRDVRVDVTLKPQGD